MLLYSQMQNYDKVEDCFYLGQPLLNAGCEHETGDEDGDVSPVTEKTDQFIVTKHLQDIKIVINDLNKDFYIVIFEK